jgi:hypothetical protein
LLSRSLRNWEVASLMAQMLEATVQGYRERIVQRSTDASRF